MTSPSDRAMWRERMDQLKGLLGFIDGYAIIKCKRVEWSAVEAIIEAAYLANDKEG